nr:nucleotide pyrophosphohydrolase [Pseudoxanthomonas sp. PXM03]
MRGAEGEDGVSNDVQELQTALRRFAEERDWGQFHTPKNLAASLSIEAAEVLEHFQWLTDEQSQNLSPEQRDKVALEIADVLLYLLQLADKLQIDPVAAAKNKLALNAEKYPVDKARGSSRKYTEL